MQITDIRVRVVSKESKMKAVVSVTFDDAFVVHDIKVIEGEKGLFIAMPSKKTPDGEYRDIAHPIHGDMRAMLQEAIWNGSSSYCWNCRKNRTKTPWEMTIEMYCKLISHEREEKNLSLVAFVWYDNNNWRKKEDEYDSDCGAR